MVERAPATNHELIVEPVYQQPGLKIERIQRFEQSVPPPIVAAWRHWSFQITLGGTQYISYRGCTYTLAPNTICWISPLQEPVRIRYLAGIGLDMLQINYSQPRWRQFLSEQSSFAQQHAALLDRSPTQPILVRQLASPSILRVIRQLLSLCAPTRSRPLREHQCVVLIELLAGLAYSSASRWQPEQQQRVEQAQQWMAANLTQPPTLSQIALQLSVSSRQLQRDFVACTGLTPIRYLNLIRLSEANVLLAETGIPIGEIATMVGYINLTHFSTAFRQIYHCSPRQMRKLLQYDA